MDDLLSEVNKRVAVNERVLVTTLTKRMAEDLTDYLAEHGVKVRYLHSDIDTVERVEIIRDLRKGLFDVLVGINLLREGLDMPEVSLVAILDADKEGFLRSARSLIQTIGRAARHINGTAILYADRMTDSMKLAIDETDRRRAKQVAFNLANGIEPKGISKRIKDLIDGVYDADEREGSAQGRGGGGEVRRPLREAARPAHPQGREGDARGGAQPRVRACGEPARRIEDDARPADGRGRRRLNDKAKDNPDVGRYGSGQVVRRIEDPALLAGRGQYTDDVAPAGPGLARVRALALSACAHPVHRYLRTRQACPACSR